MENESTTMSEHVASEIEIRRDERHRCFKNRTVYIAKDGWPIEFVIGRPVQNWIRKLLHTKRAISYHQWLSEGGHEIHFE